MKDNAANPPLYYMADYSKLVISEILLLPDFDRLTTQQMVEAVMQSEGAGAEYLSRFKESAREWVVSCLLEKAGERVTVGI